MMLGLMHFFDMILKILLGGKNLGAGAAEEGDKGGWIKVEVDRYVLLHHQDVLYLHHLKYSTEFTRLAEDKTHNKLQNLKDSDASKY